MDKKKIFKTFAAFIQEAVLVVALVAVFTVCFFKSYFQL